MARDVEEIEFTPAEPARVVAEMGRLADAGSGWINLLPGVEEDEAQQYENRSVFSAVFGSSQPPVTMCTWMPPGRTRRTGGAGGTGGAEGAGGATVGILHPRGRRAALQLGELGAPVPEGWTVRQDHPRRGLVLLVPAGAGHARVLDWMLRAGEALALAPLTGSWQARVFQPDPA